MSQIPAQASPPVKPTSPFQDLFEVASKATFREIAAFAFDISSFQGGALFATPLG